MLSLEDLGIKVQKYSSKLTQTPPDCTIGRVAAVERGQRHLVLTANGPLWSTTSGRMQAEGPPLAVGDWVVVKNHEQTVQLLPRRSYISRRAAGRRGQPQIIATNLDRVFIVTAVGEEFSPRRIERYITLAHEGGVQPVVVVNKTDLPFDAIQLIKDLDSVAPGVPLCMVSGRDQYIDELQPFLQPQQTVALVGSSGVGKSTLINALLGTERQATGNVRTKDEKGRHTTTRRELVVMPGPSQSTPPLGLLIDTPGMREVGLTDTTESVRATFSDVETLAQLCRYANCTHSGEPQCAVAAALSTGELSVDRWQSYDKLRKESMYEARRADTRNYRDTKSRWKTIHKELKVRRKIDHKLKNR